MNNATHALAVCMQVDFKSLDNLQINYIATYIDHSGVAQAESARLTKYALTLVSTAFCNAWNNCNKYCQ